jgi:peptidoglycan-associated lipoprotein
VKTSLRAALLSATVAFVIAGCATPPVVKLPTTTVILLPDEDGHVGAVSVSSEGGTQQITEGFASSTVTGLHGAPTAMNAMNRDAVSADFENLLKAQPPKPVSFILYFELDRAVLTEESKTMIPAVIAALRERKPTEVSIYGHADAIGTERRNDRLSAERARVVAHLLKKEEPDLGHIQTQYFGDKTPLIQSGARAEPRNRRAEVVIL